MLHSRRLARITFLLSTLVAAAVVPQAAFITDAKAASSAKRKVAVGVFDGNKKSDEVRAAFIDALKADGNYDVTDAEDVKPGKAKAMAETAKGLDVDVIITGKVSKQFGLKLKVYNGADGKVLDEADVKGGALGKLKANIEKNGVSSVAAAIGQVEVEEEEKPAEEETPAEETPTEETPAEEAPADAGGEGDGLSPLDLTAGLRPMHRTFEFRNTLADVRPGQGFRELLRYELPLGPVVFIDANFYPGSLAGGGPMGWLGVTAGFEKGFATESVFAEGEPGVEKTLKTNEMQWYGGLRFRLPVGAHQLGATGTYGQHTFGLTGDEAKFENGVQVSRPLIPDVKYSYAKIGVDGLFRFGEFLAGARVGKRFVFSTGGLETTWFPNTSTSSLEAGVTAGYRLASMLDLVVGVDWLRYAFDFNPVAPRPAGSESVVAGGAVDEYITGHIAFRFQLPGAGEAAP